MNDQINTLKDDLAFMRSLAQEGRAPPPLGGAILVSAGTCYSAASVVQWAVMAGVAKLSPLAINLVWLGATVLFLACLAVLKQRQGARTLTPGNRAVSMAWTSVGWSIFALFASVAIVCWRTHSGIPTLLLPSIILALYGAAWSVAAAVSGLKWTRLTAIGSYVLALVTAWLSIEPAVMLVYAGALILLAVIPGLALMRHDPAKAV